jgi:hypothetical protein
MVQLPSRVPPESSTAHFTRRPGQRRLLQPGKRRRQAVGRGSLQRPREKRQLVGASGATEEVVCPHRGPPRPGPRAARRAVWAGRRGWGHTTSEAPLRSVNELELGRHRRQGQGIAPGLARDGVPEVAQATLDERSLPLLVAPATSRAHGRLLFSSNLGAPAPGAVARYHPLCLRSPACTTRPCSRSIGTESCS